MESSLSKQTRMEYVPPACGQDAYGTPIVKEATTYGREGFVQESQGFPPSPHHHHHIDRNTYPHDANP